MILDLLKAWVPNVAEAFDDYRLGAHTFSRQEMEVLRRMVSWVPESKVDGISDREMSAFRKAIGIDG